MDAFIFAFQEKELQEAQTRNSELEENVSVLEEQVKQIETVSNCLNFIGCLQMILSDTRQ